ncbi:acetylornithine deacetylase (ArgE) [Sediminispirochaeta smaragdinae DSM 11293]|uniref:Acetylornithine deacetylase (ArgE) n=2 Tax=Sediminispirochaeta TaxID=1911556 RepID=E1RA70_SEDSS|nr:acetylornithine deacetylase (ArgE) [Sediminispirochaeta smaragdinae DSM 11293]
MIMEQQLEKISQEAVRILSDLVSFRSVSGSDNEDIITYIADYLISYGLSPKRISAGRSHSNNLFVTIGESRDGGVLLSGHTDIVPASGAGWDSDPFVLSPRQVCGEEMLYGRGACDMKGFLAAILALVPRWIEKRLGCNKEPIHLAFTYDEEIGCIGVDDLIAELGSCLPRPDAVLVGEPTLLRPADGHKSASRYITTVKGVSTHSSRPASGVNAIYGANHLIAELQRFAGEIQSRSSRDPEARRFDPPYSTISLGTIHGGTAINVVAEQCELGWEARALPWEDPQQYLRHIEDFSRHLSETLPDGKKLVFTHRLDSFLPGLSPKASKAYGYYQAMMVAGNKIPQPTTTVAFGTEAGKYDQAGIPALIWGPGSIDRAHGKNEYIEKQQLVDCCALLSKL